MKKVTLSYEQSKTTEDEVQRRTEAAFDVLFEEVFRELKNFNQVLTLVSSKKDDDRNIALPVSA